MENDVRKWGALVMTIVAGASLLSGCSLVGGWGCATSDELLTEMELEAARLVIGSGWRIEQVVTYDGCSDEDDRNPNVTLFREPGTAGSSDVDELERRVKADAGDAGWSHSVCAGQRLPTKSVLGQTLVLGVGGDRQVTTLVVTNVIDWANHCSGA